MKYNKYMLSIGFPLLAHRRHPGLSGYGMKGRQFRPMWTCPQLQPQPQRRGAVTDAGKQLWYRLTPAEERPVNPPGFVIPVPVWTSR